MYNCYFCKYHTKNKTKYIEHLNNKDNHDIDFKMIRNFGDENLSNLSIKKYIEMLHKENPLDIISTFINFINFDENCNMIIENDTIFIKYKNSWIVINEDDIQCIIVNNILKHIFRYFIMHSIEIKNICNNDLEYILLSNKIITSINLGIDNSTNKKPKIKLSKL